MQWNCSCLGDEPWGLSSFGLVCCTVARFPGSSSLYAEDKFYQNLVGIPLVIKVEFFLNVFSLKTINCAQS
jgi:hypothetical protein